MLPRALLASLFLALLGAMPAVAQGTVGLLPDPISTGDLIEWFEELDATSEQRAAILALHDEYLAKCGELRAGRIAELLLLEKKAQPTQPIGFLTDERDLQRCVRELESINMEIERLDRDLMERVGQRLPDEKQEALDHLRQRHERTRSFSDPFVQRWLSNAYSLTEIRGVAVAAKLTEDEIATIAPHVQAYERSLTAELERLGQISHAHVLDYRDALDQAGMRHDPDHIRGGAIQEEQVRIWSSMREKPGEQARKILRLRAEHVSKAAGSLPVDSGHRYRIAFIRGGGSVTARHDREAYRLDLEFEKYLERDDVPHGDRVHLIEIRDRYHQQWVGLYDEMQEASIECYGGTSFVWTEEMMARQAEFQEWSEGWIERCQALAQTARTAITGVIGPERAAEMTATYDQWREELAAKNRESEPDQIFIRSPARRSMEQLQFLPPQVKRADFELYATYLALSEEQRQTALEQFSAYLSDLRGLAARELEGLYRSPAWTVDPETGEQVPPPMDEFERVESNRDRMRAAMEALHKRLLADIESLLEPEPGGERIATIELHLDGRSLAECQSPSIDDWSGYTEVQANIIDAILRASLPDASREQALAIVLAHDDALRSRWIAHFETQRRQLLESQRAMADLAELYARKASVDEIIQSEPARRAQPFADEVIAARNAVIDLNRAVLAEVEAALPERQANTVRLSYLREAYPALFADPSFDLMFIPQTMSLAGITDKQTIELAVIEWDHAQAYTDLSMQMCEILRESPAQGAWGSGNPLDVVNDRKTRQEQVDCLRFYRNELNHRARLRVQDILTPEQWAALGSAAVAVPGTR